jgi:hypothetical protein
VIALLVGCGPSEPVETDVADTAAAGPSPFADRIVAFTPGDAAGFGQDELPDVVLGPPDGDPDGIPSLDVLSLGREGAIVLAFDDLGLVDGDGVDLLVFENPMPAWIETGVVAVSEDGATWAEFPCDAADAADGYPGCAGVNPVYAGADGADPTDPATAGGDGFDLATVGVERARYVRIVDSGANVYSGNAGGFDLDAIAVVHGAAVE